MKILLHFWDKKRGNYSVGWFNSMEELKTFLSEYNVNKLDIIDVMEIKEFTDLRCMI